MPSNNSKARRDKRKKDAQARMESRSTRNAYEQALAIASRPGESKKERGRLGLGEAPSGRGRKAQPVADPT